jgi:hypothetical protein
MAQPPFYWEAVEWPGVAVGGGDTIEAAVWVAEAAYIDHVEVLMRTKHSVGSYTFTATNTGPAKSILTASSYDMAALTADVVTSLVLSSSVSDRTMAAGTLLGLSMASDNASFDGDGIHVRIRLRRGRVA